MQPLGIFVRDKETNCKHEVEVNTPCCVRVVAGLKMGCVTNATMVHAVEDPTKCPWDNV